MAGAGKPLTLFHLKVNAMKRVLLSVLTLFLMSVVVYGQQEVTTFLGIPVDGSKSEMIQKLKEKGFMSDPEDPERLIGEFNGKDVYLSVATNKNKVWRIMVLEAHPMNEADVRIRFNNLCQQFLNNGKYSPMLYSNCEIPDDEDISYEMKIHNKRYEAAFYQRSVLWNDSVALSKAVQPILLEKFTAEQLANPTEEIRVEMGVTKAMYISKLQDKKVVWMTIANMSENYYIVMYYDNKYNEANGEDL